MVLFRTLYRFRLYNINEEFVVINFHLEDMEEVVKLHFTWILTNLISVPLFIFQSIWPRCFHTYVLGLSQSAPVFTVMMMLTVWVNRLDLNSLVDSWSSLMFAMLLLI